MSELARALADALDPRRSFPRVAVYWPDDPDAPHNPDVRLTWDDDTIWLPEIDTMEETDHATE